MAADDGSQWAAARLTTSRCSVSEPCVMGSVAAPWPTDELMQAFYAKKIVTIVAIDLGFGGLAILSAIERKLLDTPLAPKVNLLYLAGKQNMDKILQGTARHHPDMILIACNTLSAVYPRTEYAKTASIPVVSIIPFGVCLFARAMLSDPVAPVLLIFGSPQTAASGTHRDSLVNEHGIAAERIVVRACRTLHSSIEKFGPGSAETKTDVFECVRGAWHELINRQLSSVSTIFVALACTHYGYAMPSWTSALKEMVAQGEGGIRADVKTSVLDPNSHMASYVFEHSKRTACPVMSSVSIRVLSVLSDSFVVPKRRIAKIGPYLSLPVYLALQQLALHEASYAEHDVTTNSSQVAKEVVDAKAGM
eukprot:gnl/TRDRNA2_/TRDRNA2_76416_c0_seq1.p1 gnl/TRDRNA2_/TRDRNA2_76416_c0~~gnl/TRDRNA2_/TRDRNA2_76416_c0_seq1.p1  ORF type:complete len:364 (-),score=31.91 gnl/TRDRNA2_/TRDRNA2_76416_c0_seq1:200-1291(-)